MKKTNHTDEDTLEDFYSYIETLPNRQEFIDYVDECIKKSKGDIGWEFLGFMDDYMNLAKIISKDSIVVDVGCAYGFQHIIFEDFKEYIGIDISCTPKAFTKNARFIKGKFVDVIREERLKITDKMFGIDNMALLYGNNEQDIHLFNELFKKKFSK